MSNFCVSDLHGCYNHWKQIQSFCKDSDRIFVLGDCIDRGPEPLDTLKSVLGDPRVVLLKGNHEQMFQNVLEEERDFGYVDESWGPYVQNGGLNTYNQWQADGCDFNWISVLKNLPMHAHYINSNGDKYFMTHSGTTPGWYRPDGTPIASGHLCMWDRQHIDKGYSGKWICVGGHTPIAFMLPRDAVWEGGALEYCGGRKINLDNGTFASGISCLLDLDTYDEHIFEG